MKIAKGLLLFMSLGIVMSSCNKDEDQATPKPVADFSATGGACQSNCPITFTNASKNAGTYTWRFGDGQTGTQADPTFTHTYANAGSYAVTLIAKGAGGTDSITKMISVGTPAGCNYQVVQVNADIAGNTTWESCKVYVVNTSISVTGSLTVQPGAIVKFKPGTTLTVSSTGTLRADGNSSTPIVFTSYKDDAHGGDTNGDLVVSAPARNDWGGIILSDANGSSFKYCMFLYSGSQGGALELWEAAATIQNCTFAYNNGGAPAFKGALSARQAAAATVIKDNVFYGNLMPLSMNTSFSLDNTNTFHNPADANQKNTHNGIWLVDNLTDQNITLAETEVPFVNYEASIGFHHVLTLAAGVIFKSSASGNLTITDNARILAQGTAANPVIFTSYTDDAHGGDTNADGSSTSPAPKHWGEILIDGGSGSVFDNCLFMYGGSNNSGSTLSIPNAAVTVRNCTFARNFGGGNAEYNAALDASRAEVNTVIQNNIFYGNVRPLSISSAFDLDDSNTFHNPDNTAQRNTFDAIMTVWGGSTTKQNLKWSETEVAFTHFYSIDIAATNTLELGNDVVLKFNSDQELIIRASASRLIGGNRPGVVFTSIKDDSVGGDSNGNGAVDSPANGNWEGIFVDSSPGVWLNWSNIKYDSH